MLDAKYLLTDEAMRDFILNGYVTVHVPVAMLEEAYRQTDEAAKKDKVGSNILAQAPALASVFNHDAVRGALTSILGPNYCNYGDRYCHHMPPQPEGVAPGWHRTNEHAFHRDPSFGPARHRCRAVMSVFFPHDCTPDMGPTGIAPGTQYYTRTASASCHEAFQVAAPAGAVTFIHYDLWHTPTCNYSNKSRYMMKFTYVRTEEPTEPSWNCKDTTWKLLERGPSGHEHPDLWECMWNWNCGKPGLSGDDRVGIKDITHLIAALRDEDETVGLQSAYALARIGEPAIAPLLEKLIEESTAAPNELLHGRAPGKGGKGGGPCQIYNSGYALAAIGTPAVSGLTRLLKHEHWWVRGAAADTLREMGRPGLPATDELVHALHDEHEKVRELAAEALGTIAPVSDQVIQALVERLEDKPRDVRFAAVGSLVRIRPTPEFAIPALIKTLDDEVGYVRSYALVALERIGTNETRRAIKDFLTARPDESCLTA